MPAHVLAVGFGNSLMGDDGVGPAVVTHLAKLGIPPGVRVADGGTDATVLADLWQGEEWVVLVDALARGSPPGTIHRLKLEDVLRLPQEHQGVHALSLPSCLRWVLLARPELAEARVELFGVEPARVVPGQGLTSEVKAAVEQLAQELWQQWAVFS